MTGSRGLPSVQVRPHVELVPVWIQNSYRVMPRGFWFPVPLLCSITFGGPVRPGEGENKTAFLARLRDALAAVETM